MASRVETMIRAGVTKGIEALASHNRRSLPKREHQFLSGVHRPMEREKTLSELEVIGAIPQALSGRYLRIGPNPIDPNPASYHWFTGDGMVHGLAIENGRALWYRNRWIRSNAVAASLGVAPAPGPRLDGFDTVNTNIVGIAGRTFALVEGSSYPVEMSDTLEDQRYNPFDDTLQRGFTAHPHRDPLTGEFHAIGYDGKRWQEIRHVVISPEGKVTREEPIAVRHGPLIHDCAITSRYVVILDLPVTFSMRTLVAGHDYPYAWNPSHQARVGLLPRDGTQADIVWCEMDPAFVFHVANAYDEADGRVTMDVCAFPSMFSGEPGGPEVDSRGLERWTIDPKGKSVSTKTLSAAQQEFPRIDERLTGQRHRYVYTMGLAGGGNIIGTCLHKHDVVTGEHRTHDFGAGRHPGEFVFVPAHADSAEDEGWMIGLVIDAAADTTDLAILDARRFSDEPVARIRLPHRVPPGFHGNWFPNITLPQANG